MNPNLQEKGAIETFSPGDPRLRWEFSELAGHTHASCYTDTGFGGSGFSLKREAAQRKAFAELNERYIVYQLVRHEKWKKDWKLDFDSSCSGFSVGFSKDKTLLRSLLEGCERWALSQWADKGFILEPIKAPHSEVLEQMGQFFSESTLFKIEVPLLFGENLIKAQVAVFLGWTENGVYAGYGTKLSLRDAIEHSSIEALRNYLIHKNQQTRSHFPYNRIHYFANSRKVAEEVVASIQRSDSWPTPQLSFVKIESFNDLWIARSIFRDWRPWQDGSVSRFLY